MSVSVKFCTRKFEASHGRAPKGWGMWMFQVTGDDFMRSASGTLTQAKKVVAAQVRRDMKDFDVPGTCTVLHVEVMP